MRYQNGLREIRGEIRTALFLQTRELPGRGFSQGLRVQLVQMEARLEWLEHLKRFKTAQRNRAQELFELIRTHA
jgi:hypothetical protein